MGFVAGLVVAVGLEVGFAVGAAVGLVVDAVVGFAVAEGFAVALLPEDGLLTVLLPVWASLSPTVLRLHSASILCCR